MIDTALGVAGGYAASVARDTLGLPAAGVGAAEAAEGAGVAAEVVEGAEAAGWIADILGLAALAI